MKFIADFHLHSKYSRATSRDMDVENLDKWARIKGIKVLGTGDFTHPLWLKELKEKLEPAEPGLFKMKKNQAARLFNDWLVDNHNQDDGSRFLLTTEISCIYSKNNRTRKIHIIVFAPSFSVVEKINTHLGWIGNLKADGRPILGLDAKELLKIVLNISEECLVVPAHCLLPDTYLHSNPGIKAIKDISVGDSVYTHQGRLRGVKNVYRRFYKGPIYNIKPYYFRLGLQTTSEHPFLGIKSQWCPSMNHTICKKDCSYIKQRNCPHKYFENYRPQWIQAKDIEKGNILIFPRFNKEIKDVKEIKLSKYLNQKDYILDGEIIKPNGSKRNLIPNIVEINKDFCRLVGYYLSEGYTDNRDSISFCFSNRERKYIKDVRFLMEKIFGLSSPRIYKRENSQGLEIIYFSKILTKLFSQLFYNSEIRKAHTKCLPFWMMELPLEKQIEAFRGWWRGDTGYTSSRSLMNQMKIICLRLGIIPSIREDLPEMHLARGNHQLGDRIISAQHSAFYFSNLSFFDNQYGLLKEPEFKKFKTKLKRRHGWLDEKYVYIPVRDIEITNYQGEVYNIEVDKDNSYVSEFATIHNCWTPWFSLFGSNSGFDSLEECFEEYAKYIYTGETGLSSDPKMNWRLSALDKIALVSNSDAHSPQKLGREANVFETEISYPAMIEAIKTKDPQKFLQTIEFFPEEGKYHYDGHRNCQVSLSPSEAKKLKNICSKCGRPLTIGVLHRIDDLADRKEGEVPARTIPFKHLIPLEEIIADAKGVGVASKSVREEYKNLIKRFGCEFKVLLEIGRQQIEQASSAEITEGVMRVREGKVYIEPGYDGEYGKIKIFKDEERGNLSKQASLF